MLGHELKLARTLWPGAHAARGQTDYDGELRPPGRITHTIEPAMELGRTPRYVKSWRDP